MTLHLKSLILKRQKGFQEYGVKTAQFKFYHNAVNRERKSCKAVFFKTKVQSTKEENPKAWSREAKRFSGVRVHSGALCNRIHGEGADEPSPQELANAIIEPFLEPVHGRISSAPPTCTNPGHWKRTQLTFRWCHSCSL